MRVRRQGNLRSMVTALARIALNAVVPAGEQHLRDLSLYEMVTVTGVGETWDAAKAACVISDGAVILHWMREDG